jgi:peptidoglycan/LPS O-acetylase OafA/YrhL
MYYRWAFGLLLGLAIPQFGEIPWTWLKKVCKTIAKYSYGIYLSHMFVMSIAFVVIHNHFAQWSLFLFFAALLPYAMYHLIENPGIQLGKKFANRVLQPAAAKTASVTVDKPELLPVAIAADNTALAVPELTESDASSNSD